MVGSFGARALLLVASVLVHTEAPAATFQVNRDRDEPDAAVGNGVCATSRGKCTLRAAFQEANALPGADRIELHRGLYDLTIRGGGEDAAATGDLDVTDDLLLVGEGANSTIIDGGGVEGIRERVLDVRPGPTVELRGVTLRGGLAPTDHDCNGGGIYNAGALTLREVVLSSNTVFEQCPIGPSLGSNAGGGAFNVGVMHVEGGRVEDNWVENMGAGIGNGAGGTLFMTGTQIQRNMAGDGGGVLHVFFGVVEKQPRSGSRTDLVDVVIRENTADSSGGGVAIVKGGNIAIRGSTITGNDAPAGAGVFVSPAFPVDLDPIPLLERSVVAGNVGGDGIFCDRSVLEVLESTISGNERDGIAARAFGSFVPGVVVDVDRSTVSSNGDDGLEGAVRLLNSTVSGNAGSGIVSGGPTDLRTIVIHNSTIVDNSIGIEDDNELQDVWLRASILANVDADCSEAAQVVSFGHNLIRGGGCGTPAEGDLTGVDPLLTPLGHHGGPTQTHALPPESPAIDHVPRANCVNFPDRIVPPLVLDQRGFPRPGTAVDACDAGAVEFQGAADTDGDGDGVPHRGDACPSSIVDPTVVVDGCDSGVDNIVGPDGCTISDRVTACAEAASNHGAFRSCVSELGDELQRTDVLTGPEKDQILSCAGRAELP